MPQDLRRGKCTRPGLQVFERLAVRAVSVHQDRDVCFMFSVSMCDVERVLQETCRPEDPDGRLCVDRGGEVSAAQAELFDQRVDVGSVIFAHVRPYQERNVVSRRHAPVHQRRKVAAELVNLSDTAVEELLDDVRGLDETDRVDKGIHSGFDVAPGE